MRAHAKHTASADIRLLRTCSDRDGTKIVERGSSTGIAARIIADYISAFWEMPVWWTAIIVSCDRGSARLTLSMAGVLEIRPGQSVPQRLPRTLAFIDIGVHDGAGSAVAWRARVFPVAVPIG
jgi:hypothetical protein